MEVNVQCVSQMTVELRSNTLCGGDMCMF